MDEIGHKSTTRNMATSKNQKQELAEAEVMSEHTATIVVEAQITDIASEQYQRRVEEFTAQITQTRKAIEEEENNYELVKASIAEDFDDSFTQQIEESKAFENACGEQFEFEFLNHRFRKVRKWSESRRRLVGLQQELEGVEAELQRLQEDQVHMTKTPAELYRMIQELREEIGRFRQMQEARDREARDREAREQEEFYRQREILMDLYHSTNGDGWEHNDNWGSTQPLSEWFGVKCDARGNVIELVLGHDNEGNNLRGMRCFSRTLSAISN